MQQFKKKLKNTPRDASQVSCSVNSQLNKEETLSVESGLKNDKLFLNNKQKVLVCSCLICNKSDIKQIGCHLRKSHNISTDEYLLQFPYAQISSTNFNPNTVSKIKQKLQGRECSVEHKKNIKKAKLESHRKDSSIARKQSESLKKSYLEGKVKPVQHTEKTKKQISKKLKGVYIRNKNPMYGKKHTLETRKVNSEKNSGSNNHMYGKTHSEETREKMRIAKIQYIQKTKTKGQPLSPTIGKNECKILDSIEKEKNITILRQFYIRGYWCDGYCEKTNTVYEVDEAHHYDIDGNLLEKDIIRENNIKKYLKCNFIRIKDDV